MILNLPRNYVEIEEEEMMYIEGGGYWTHVGHAEWTYTITPREFANMAAAVGVGLAVSAAIAKYAPDATIKAAAGAIATLGGVGAALLTAAACTNGFRIYFHTMWWGRQPRWAQFI